MVLSWAAWVAADPNFAFQAMFLTSQKSEMVFFMDFQASNIIIARDLTPCDAANNCQIVSGQVEHAVYNNTRFSYQVGQMLLCASHDRCFPAPIWVSDLPGHILGVNSRAIWANALAPDILVVNCLTGDTNLVRQAPTRVATLGINSKDGSFFLPAMLISSYKGSTGRTRYSNFKLQLQFPKASNDYNGEYFFLMNKRELDGWDDFLANMLTGFNHKKAKHLLELEHFGVEFNHKLFPSYDRNPFKKASQPDFGSDYAIGKFFLAKTQLSFYLAPNPGAGAAAAVALSDGDYGDGLSFSPVTLIQFLALATLMGAGALLIWRCVRKLQPAEEDGAYAHI